MVVRDKVTRQCPETTTSEVKARRAEADSNRGPSAYQPNALPIGQTGSPASDLNAQAVVISYDPTGYVSGQNTKTAAAAARGQWY